MNKLIFNDIYELNDIDVTLTIIERDKDVVVIFYKPDIEDANISEFIIELNKSIYDTYQTDIKELEVVYYMIVETMDEYDDFYIIHDINTYDIEKLNCTNIFQFLNN